jgi:acyl-CoA synthetase (AMP-forming)/AMP-acid ligase II
MSITPIWSTLIDLLRDRSQSQPNKTAYTFLQNGDTAANSLTYHSLDERARAIAAYLQQHNAQGERVLLLYPQDLEVIAAFCGCLYAGAIAVPLPPPDPARLKRTLPRIQAVVQDAQATFIFTTSQIKSTIESLCAEITEFDRLHLVATEELNASLATAWQAPTIDGDTLAYLQYTSGSTSVPKGVMISHTNLMHNSACINQSFRYTADSISATWLPYFHDYGLVDGLMQPLYAGIPSYVMSPLAFIKRPFRWLQAISQYQVTHSSGPNFAYEYCIRQISPEQRTSLDLSSWRVASIGAEPIRRATLDAFFATFSESGLKRSTLNPGYGLAEATLTVSLTTEAANGPIFGTFAAAALEKNQAIASSSIEQTVRTVASCGQPVGDLNVVIVHPDQLTRCNEQEVGEIWVSGKSIALGYWQNSEATDRTFQAYLKDTGEGPFLRTGDLGFLQAGELFVTGRLKDLIIIGGANHCPHDIELTTEKSHPAIKPTCSAAFSIDVDGEAQLVIVAELERRYLKERRLAQAVELPDAIDLRREQRRQAEVVDNNIVDGTEPTVDQQLDVEAVTKIIRQQVSEHHELRVHAIALLRTGSIPKTSSGKIQRSACRQGFLEGSLEVFEEWRERSQVVAM